jgi:virulence-associated protein VapD
MGCSRVVFEGDSLQVVQAVCNDQAWNRYAQLIADVHTMLHEFPFHKVQYVSIDANKVAHRLAKLAVNRSCDYVWIDECLSPV